MPTRNKSSKTSKFLLGIISVSILLVLIYTSNTIAVRAEGEPDTPANFRVSGTTSTGIFLTWDTVPEATGYTVYKWVPGEDFVLYENVVGTSYTDDIINCKDPNKNYGDYYELKAYNSNGSSLPTGWIQGSPLNDNFSQAIDLATVPDSKNLLSCNATPDDRDPEITECNMDAGIATVWYKYTSGSTSAISLDTNNSDYDTFIAIWTGTQTDYDNNTLTSVVCNNDQVGTEQSEVGFQTTAGVTYYVEIGQYTGTISTSENLRPPASEALRTDKP